jgi:hypothetical protein
MSVVEKDLLFDDTVQALGDDRVGLAARLAYIGMLANSHVTASDGTLPFSQNLLRQQLLPGVALTADEATVIMERLVDSGLVVPFEAQGRRYAIVANWWRFNTRPDKATRNTRHPPVPPDLLAQVPTFAAVYATIPARGERGRRPTGKSRKVPAQSGTSRPPDPEPEPEAATAADPAPAPASLARSASVVNGPIPPIGMAAIPEAIRLVLPIINRFEKTYEAAYQHSYPTSPDEQDDVLCLWAGLPEKESSQLVNEVADYFRNTGEPSLSGFCEWRHERAQRFGQGGQNAGEPPTRARARP